MTGRVYTVGMAQPGWYADPTAPDGRRYWDGQRWLDPEPKRRGASGWVWLVVALTVVGAVVAALLILPNGTALIGATPEDRRTTRPTGEQWDELMPSSTPTPTEIESEFGEFIDCPDAGEWPRSDIVNGRLRGGGLSVTPPEGPEWTTSPAHIAWLHDSNSMLRSIVPGWISNINVGYIRVSDGFSADPRVAAEQFVTCMASSGMFMGFTKRTVLSNESWSVGGRPAWRLTSNVYVGDWGHEGIEGDTVDIIIVPTDDDDRLAVYVTCVTIGHEENIREVEPVLDSLLYDG